MRKYLIALVVILSMLCSTVITSAAPDPAVVLVNPVSNSSVYSNNVLISIKVTQPKIIRVRVFEEKQMVNGTLSAVTVNMNSAATINNSDINKTNYTSIPVTTAASFTCSNNLSFYTKQINGLNQGLYRIQIDTVDATGKILYSNSSYVSVKEKESEVGVESKIFETPQSGTLQFFQNLLKTIFSN